MSKTRVLVVDDSAVIRRAISDLLAVDAEIEVVGHAANGILALEQIFKLKPDVITLDVEMPVMDGLETLRAMKKSGLTIPVIMCSTLTERGAMATLDALSLGAACYVTKPSSSGTAAESIDSLRRELLPKVKALGGHHNRYNREGIRKPSLSPQQSSATATGAPTLREPREASPPVAPQHITQPHIASQPRAKQEIAPSSKDKSIPLPSPRAQVPEADTPVRLAAKSKKSSKIEAVIIGVSTGGPNALAVLLPALPANLSVPVFVVQHMPPVFTKLVADRLDNQCTLTVREAVENETARAGTILIAPGDFHMTLEKNGAGTLVKLNQNAAVNFCRPAVDVMFQSAVAAYGGGLLAVVLTGMGSDGALGCEQVSAAGGQVIVQDAATSVVWGMPGAVAERGLAEAILPLEHIAKEIVRRVSALN